MRRYHPYTAWECVPAGMYDFGAGLDAEQAKRGYAEFLGDLSRFEVALQRVLNEWPISCEHFLSNQSINRIAWLGQASMCIENGTPCLFRSGFMLLDEAAQMAANAMADKYLRIWNARQDSAVHRDVEAARVSAGYTGRSTGETSAVALSAIVQSDCHGDTEERSPVAVAGIHASGIGVVLQAEAN